MSLNRLEDLLAKCMSSFYEGAIKVLFFFLELQVVSSMARSDAIPNKLIFQSRSAIERNV